MRMGTDQGGNKDILWKIIGIYSNFRISKSTERNTARRRARTLIRKPTSVRKVKRKRRKRMHKRNVRTK